MGEHTAEDIRDAILEVKAGFKENAVSWAVQCWHSQVKNRPLRNIHRPALDSTWRQVIRHFGGDPDTLVGPSHNDLMNNGEQP